MTFEKQICDSGFQELFSKAFVIAVSSVAGVSIGFDDPDEGIDWTLSGGKIRGKMWAPKIDVQVKSYTGQIPDRAIFKYQLKLKSYNDLRLDQLHTPRILLLVCIPQDPSNWLEVKRDKLVLYQHAYWVSLKGKPEWLRKTKNDRIGVEVRKENQLSPQVLQKLLQRVADGKDL